MQYIISFFDSNFFVALVGFLAIYLYFKQRMDKKRETARLILQEIRYAELQIRNSDRGHRGYALSSKLLPTNSWNDSIHLFLNRLEESEIDLISQFYSKAAYIDILIEKISDFKNLPAQSQSVLIPSGSSVSPISPMVPAVPDQNSGQNFQTLQVVIDPMNTTQGILRQISEQIEFVYNTPAGEKLKNIANKRWYQFI